MISTHLAFKALPNPLRLRLQPRQKTLSSYFPAGTSYFYGYPAGEDSGFLNKVPPKVEELVAARAFSCAGPSINIVSFAATNAPLMDPQLLDELGIPQLSADRTTLLPSEIDASIEGPARNQSIKRALSKSVAQGSLVMAQPFTDESISNLYQIPPKITTWLNDKDNMKDYLPANFVPARYASYQNGQALAADTTTAISLPCVVKAALSSAGDGVYICHTADDLVYAKEMLKHLAATIFIEAYVEARANYGVHFGIPHDPKQPIDIIGVNQQYTSPEGEFLGGIINSTTIPAELEPAKKLLIKEILPKIRAMGWYGIGCFDVLVDANQALYFIDCNFRMTGMSASHMLIAQGRVKPPLISFGGSFTGSREAFEAAIFPYAGRQAKDKILQFIALTQDGDTWNFNAALLFKTPQERQQRVALLRQAGVESAVLDYLATNA